MDTSIQVSRMIVESEAAANKLKKELRSLTAFSKNSIFIFIFDAPTELPAFKVDGFSNAVGQSRQCIRTRNLHSAQQAILHVFKFTVISRCSFFQGFENFRDIGFRIGRHKVFIGLIGIPLSVLHIMYEISSQPFFLLIIINMP